MTLSGTLPWSRVTVSEWGGADSRGTCVQRDRRGRVGHDRGGAGVGRTRAGDRLAAVDQGCGRLLRLDVVAEYAVGGGVLGAGHATRDTDGGGCHLRGHGHGAD